MILRKMEWPKPEQKNVFLNTDKTKRKKEGFFQLQSKGKNMYQE